MQSLSNIDDQAPLALQISPRDSEGCPGSGFQDSPLASEYGAMASEWSVIILTLTAVIQLGVASMSGSVALLGDTIHNFSDALSTLPLWLAFYLGRMQPGKRFSVGSVRLEDAAGAVIVLSILISGIMVGYQSIDHLFHPKAVHHLTAVAIAAFVGFIGNETVAIFRMKIGKEIGSLALIADACHARLDGFTSLAVAVGCAGIALGFPQADSIVGLLMSALTIFAALELALKMRTPSVVH